MGVPLWTCSSSIQQCLMTASVREAIRAIDSMAAVHAGLTSSGCSYLKDFLQETLTFWHKIIKDRLRRCSHRRSNSAASPPPLIPPRFFCSDFEKVLTQLHWPNVSPATPALGPTGASSQELNVQLELLVTQLLALQTTYPSAPPHTFGLCCL